VTAVTIDLSACLRCGACAILAPRTFEVTRKGARVIASPSAADVGAVRAAALVCPAQAIRVVEER
jgi:ferredoxin